MRYWTFADDNGDYEIFSDKEIISNYYPNGKFLMNSGVDIYNSLDLLDFIDDWVDKMNAWEVI